MAVEKMIMGRKVGMTQLFSEDGKAVPVTVLEVGPCYVVQRRTKQCDGYEAVQLGYMPYNNKDIKRAEEMHKLHEVRRANKDYGNVAQEPRGPHRLTLAMYGHFRKNNLTPLRFLKEFHVKAFDNFEIGQEINADVFAAGDKVNVMGTSKGRGFAGVMKRHGFHGGNESHGSMFHRKAASGGGTDAARVFPGSKRPGHMGASQVTIKGLTIIRADAEKNLLVVKGAVPGPNGGLVVVTMPERQQIERGKGRYVTFTALEKD